MNLRPHRRPDPEVNLTPLIDVVFLLLIFFMVASTFRKEAELHITLPETQHAPQIEERDRIEVVVDAAGRYRVNDEPLSADDPSVLREAIERLAGASRSQPFVIFADGNSPHRAVVQVMDAAQGLGFARISIATQTAPVRPPP